VPLPGSIRCNSVAELDGDESSARTLSADSAVHAAGEPDASAGRLLDFSADV
jgi:hypothetical protein